MRVDGFSKSEKWEASITCHHIGFLLRNCLLQANCTTLCMCNPVVNDMELRFHTTERFTLKNMRRLDERIRSCRIPYALLVIWSYCRFKQIYGSSVYSVICLTDSHFQTAIHLPQLWEYGPWLFIWAWLNIKYHYIYKLSVNKSELCTRYCQQCLSFSCLCTW